MSTILTGTINYVLYGALAGTWGLIVALIAKFRATQHGVKALLRDRLIEGYTRYTEMGYAPIYARENFQSMYDEYHNLGGNGVMEDLYSKFMELPTEPVTPTKEVIK